MLFARPAVAAVLTLSSLGSAAKQQPATPPVLGTVTVHGCYGSLGELKLDSQPEFNSQGECADKCRTANKPVAATFSYDCYCGDKYPNKNDLVDDSQCTEKCPGFGEEACGGLDTWTVYNTGLRESVGEAAEVSSSSTTSSASPTKTDTPPAAGSSNAPQTTVTAPVANAPEENQGSSSNSSTVGIAVGVVAGVLVLAGIAGGAFFWRRRKRNTEIEEEHRRNAAVNAFISGGKPPSSSGGLSMADSRMDPVMNRRMSDGSIADNQDYSRRILRVTNA